MAEEPISVAMVIKVGITESSVAALNEVEHLTGFSEDVVVNRAIQYYALLEKAKAEGKAIFMADNMERLLWDG